MTTIFAPLLALLLATAAPAPRAPAPPTPAMLEAGLAGQRRGALGYRDYQSDKLEEIPMTTRIEALPDAATILRISTFDDGPRVGDVFITAASLHDDKAGTVATTTLRKGRPVETGTEQVRIAAFADPAHWTIIFEADGSDDDKPARLRTTQVRDGDVLTATKEVQPKPGDGRWQFRNRAKLAREPR
jgi:hypothetical protein